MGEIIPPLNSVVLCASYRRNLTWHSQSSVNGTSASNLVTNKVFGSRKWQQLSKILPLKRMRTKKACSVKPKSKSHNPSFRVATKHSQTGDCRCPFALCVWQQKQYWNLKRGTKPPRIKHNVTSHFCLNLQRWRKPLNGKPKEKSTDGLRGYWRFTEKGQNWTRQLGLLPLLWWPERAAWEKPFLVMAAEETWPRSQWCSRLGPQLRALSCCRTWQGRASIPMLPFCPAASSGTWLLHAR